ncbi:MAG TPA: dienelactone hydrolase family protein [Actinomycetota bacterium]|nr:dienelactone hydrolase family protein [Actinomycetota bacterium]
MGEFVDFDAPSGSTCGYLARPEGRGPHPAVALAPAIAGVNDYVKNVATALADAGYACLAIDYHARSDGPPDLGDVQKVMAAVAAVDDGVALSDLQAARDHLATQDFVDAERVGVVGFCMGGSYALMAAARVEGIRAAVGFYGLLRYRQKSATKPLSPLDVVDDVRVPYLGHYGETDHLIPLDDVEELRARLLGRPAEVYTYPGAGHAFHESFRPDVYRPVAASAAWERTMTFLGWYLGGK